MTALKLKRKYIIFGARIVNTLDSMTKQEELAKREIFADILDMRRLTFVKPYLKGERKNETVSKETV